MKFGWFLDPESGPLGGAEVVERQPSLADTKPEDIMAMSRDELDAFKRRMREAPPEEETEPAGEQEEGGDSPDVQDEDADAASESQPTEDAAPTGDAPQQQEGRGPRRKPQTLDEAERQLASLSGNLETLRKERQAYERRISELEATRQRELQQAENQRLTAQHQAVEARIAAAPEAQQTILRQHYQNQMAQETLNSYHQYLQTQANSVQQQQFEMDKRNMPNMLREVATFVANEAEADASEVSAILDLPQVQNLLAAAIDNNALATAATMIGEWLSVEAERSAARKSAEKAQRREARKAAPPVREAPGIGAGVGGNEDMVTRIKNMDKEEFARFKKESMRAGRLVIPA